MNEWKPIETAPKDNKTKLNYILIADSYCIPDIVIWRNKQKEYIDTVGTRHLYVPAGWFSVNGDRSRLDNIATHWMPLPPNPVE